MKLKALALALLVAGFGSSYALAKGKPPKHGDSVTTSTTSSTDTTATTSGHGRRQAKFTICHKAGKSGRWVKITVASKAAKRLLNHGDVLPDASGNCPAGTPKHTTTTTSTDETTTSESGD
jgi:hypothetical protein